MSSFRCLFSGGSFLHSDTGSDVSDICMLFVHFNSQTMNTQRKVSCLQKLRLHPPCLIDKSSQQKHHSSKLQDKQAQFGNNELRVHLQETALKAKNNSFLASLKIWCVASHIVLHVSLKTDGFNPAAYFKIYKVEAIFGTFKVKCLVFLFMYTKERIENIKNHWHDL